MYDEGMVSVGFIKELFGDYLEILKIILEEEELGLDGIVEKAKTPDLNRIRIRKLLQMFEEKGWIKKCCSQKGDCVYKIGEKYRSALISLLKDLDL